MVLFAWLFTLLCFSSLLWNKDVVQLGFYQEAQEEFSSKLIQVFGRIEFFVILGLRSTFPCWLSAGGCH